MNITPPPHVSESCTGEKCQMCDQPATHKVGEEFAHDQPFMRHNFTAYVCCRCFGEIFGPVAMRYCEVAGE